MILHFHANSSYWLIRDIHPQLIKVCRNKYEGWNFNGGNYLFTNDTKIDTCFEVLLSFTVVTSIVYNPLPATWKS